MPERKACQWQKVTITVITAIALGTTAMAIMAAVTAATAGPGTAPAS